jgi:rsbT co-antagonist protein RsbR
MPTGSTSTLQSVLADKEVLADWIQLQLSSNTLRSDLMRESELRAQSSEFVALLTGALRSGHTRIESQDWESTREFLGDMSRTRALQGFSPTETATFVLSLKQPLFSHLRKRVGDSQQLVEQMWAVTTLLDGLALHTAETYLKNREEIIGRQQQELMELSTPVVQLWENILALPLIGTLDSARTQVVMENLLQTIVQTGAAIAIIDITGVPTVDTLVAQHLLKTVAAARLMGADCIISGIRPQIAQTIVHLGVNLADVTTKATLADAFAIALRRTGASLGRTPTAP